MRKNSSWIFWDCDEDKIIKLASMCNLSISKKRVSKEFNTFGEDWKFRVVDLTLNELNIVMDNMENEETMAKLNDDVVGEGGCSYLYRLDFDTEEGATESKKRTNCEYMVDVKVNGIDLTIPSPCENTALEIALEQNTESLLCNREYDNFNNCWSDHIGPMVSLAYRSDGLFMDEIVNLNGYKDLATMLETLERGKK